MPRARREKRKTPERGQRGPVQGHTISSAPQPARERRVILFVRFLKPRRGCPGNANIGEHGEQVNIIKKENLLSQIKFTTSLGPQRRGCSNPAPAPATPSPAQPTSRPPRARWGTRRSPGWAAGPSALSLRRAAQPCTSGAGSAANEARVGQRTQRVSESGRSPESDSGTLFLLMVALHKNNNKKFFSI